MCRGGVRATDEPWLGKLGDRDTGNHYTSQMTWVCLRTPTVDREAKHTKPKAAGN